MGNQGIVFHIRYNAIANILIHTGGTDDTYSRKLDE